MTETPRTLSAEEIGRLNQLEKKQLVTTLINIRELNPDIYADGLDWVEISVAIIEGSFTEEVGIADLRLRELQGRYPKPSKDPDSEFQNVGIDAKTSSLLMHDTVLPMLGRLYDLDGAKFFSQAYQLKILPKHSVGVLEGGGN